MSTGVEALIAGSSVDLRIYADLDELSQAAAELFAQRAQVAFWSQSRFTVALAGGSTPRPVYERLATPGFRVAIPWEATHFFWGDERCVPPDHPESNYRMAMEALVSKVPVPLENIHRMAGEQPPNAAANAYAETLRNIFSLTGTETPRFDLILLGMGGDGHTASLFPRTEVLHEQTRLVAAHYVEKLATFRLTLTPPVINNASLVVFLVAGKGKAETLRQVLQGPYVPDELPAQFVRPSNGHLVWMVDEAAASMLDQA
ncbi:MAG: 6-phosphogluconolactonase [Anaerolineae bacterium]